MLVPVNWSVRWTESEFERLEVCFSAPSASLRFIQTFWILVLRPNKNGLAGAPTRPRIFDGREVLNSFHSYICFLSSPNFRECVLPCPDRAWAPAHRPSKSPIQAILRAFSVALFFTTSYN